MMGGGSTTLRLASSPSFAASWREVLFMRVPPRYRRFTASSIVRRVACSASLWFCILIKACRLSAMSWQDAISFVVVATEISATRRSMEVLISSRATTLRHCSRLSRRTVPYTSTEPHITAGPRDSPQPVIPTVSRSGSLMCGSIRAGSRNRR